MQEARELVREPSTDFAANPLEVNTACSFCSLTHGDRGCSIIIFYAFGGPIVACQHVVERRVGEGDLRQGENENTARMACVFVHIQSTSIQL
jgi:hypothetical protein